MGDAYDFNNRITILKEISADELDTEINQSLFKHLMSEGYTDFVNACQYVKDHPEVSRISCYRQDGKFYFVFS